MIKSLKHPLFFGASAVFLGNQVLEYFGIFIPFIHSYLDDVLVMPILLCLALALMRLLYQNPNGQLKLSQILIATLWMSFLFEYWYPSYKANHFADAWDVLAYFVGSCGFFFTGRKEGWVKVTGATATNNK